MKVSTHEISDEGDVEASISSSREVQPTGPTDYKLARDRSIHVNLIFLYFKCVYRVTRLINKDIQGGIWKKID